MVFLTVLRRQREILLGRLQPDTEKLTVDTKIPYDEEENDRCCTFPCFTTVYLWVAIILMALLASVGGIYLYVEYGPNAQSDNFHGWCNIPMHKDEYLPLPEELWKNTQENDLNTFHQEFDISPDEQQAKIVVPEFRNSKRGRFLHDFTFNLTAIVDMDSKRCFVMPLDRNAVLPPRSLIDMLNKMMSGYYNVNMNLVKRDMVVEIPPITDYSTVGFHIAQGCYDYPIYRLKKSTRTLFKRSADGGNPAKFVEFAGNNIQEFDILNFDDVLKYEEQMRNNPK